MFAKIFTQIFDSSIAENCRIRHVFEDLLKLADRTGAVDMTVEAVARRTNVPLEEVRAGIAALLLPDPKSRSQEQQGRRLVPLDPTRDWGWMIVSYEHYRGIQNAEALRDTWREAKAKQRQTLRVKIGNDLKADPLTKSDKREMRRINKAAKEAQLHETEN